MGSRPNRNLTIFGDREDSNLEELTRVGCAVHSRGLLQIWRSINSGIGVARELNDRFLVGIQLALRPSEAVYALAAQRRGSGVGLIT
jgi:hypothetical protein